MCKLDVIIIIIQIEAQNLRNTFEPISITVLHGLLFQMLKKKKNAKTSKNLEAGYVALWKTDLKELKNLND